MSPSDVEVNSSIAPEQTLGDLFGASESHGEPFRVMLGRNLGHTTLNMTLPMHRFFDLSEVANERAIAERGGDSSEVAQRKLDMSHAKGIATYLLKGLVKHAKIMQVEAGNGISEAHERLVNDLGDQPYQGMAGIVANIRNCQPNGTDLRVRQVDGSGTIVFLNQSHILWVVDGQHRRAAMDIVFDFLKSVLNTHRYPKKGLFLPAHNSLEVSPQEADVWGLALQAAKTSCTVDIQVHLGLTAKQERQLFHDLNNLAKPVERSVAQKFDAANPVNQFVSRILEGEGLIRATVVDHDTAHVWNRNDGSISRKDLVAANAMLFDGKSDPKKVMATKVNNHVDLGRRFWSAVNNQPHFGEPGSNTKTILAAPVVLKGLCTLVYTFHDSREADPQHLERLLTALENGEIDFAHTNPMWRVFEMSKPEREAVCPGISASITPPESGFANLTVGTWDEKAKVMRFASNSRDVARHLGDIIRWKLNFPIRAALKKIFDQIEENRTEAA